MPNKNPKIAILGAGIIGLTTALQFLQSGYKNVTLISDRAIDETNSMLAGGIWRPWKGKPEKFFWQLCTDSLPIFEKLSENANTGVRYITDFEICKKSQIEKPEWLQHVTEVTEDLLTIDEKNILFDLRSKCIDHPIYIAKVPIVDPHIFLPWLQHEIERLNGKFLKEHIDKASNLFDSYEVVIVCAGEQTRHVIDDSLVYPVQGQVLKIEMPELTTAILDVDEISDFTYLIPHPASSEYPNGYCTVGGTYQKLSFDVKNLDVTPSPDISKAILARAARLYPPILNSKILQECVGFRCARDTVRIDCTLLGNTILGVNCGQAGSGFTASFASAMKMVNEVNKLLLLHS